MIRDSRDRFTQTVDLYARWRPSYPAALIDGILALSPAGRIADVGCGTGISTRLFLKRGRDVIGIDPNEAMFEAVRQGPGTYARGEATATGLPDASVSLVAGGQAFHWFDLDPAFCEARVPDGSSRKPTACSFPTT